MIAITGRKPDITRIHPWRQSAWRCARWVVGICISLLVACGRQAQPPRFSFRKEYGPAMISAFPAFSSPGIHVFMNSNYPKLEYIILLYGSGFFAILGKRFPKSL
jgi:hypothetical protein